MNAYQAMILAMALAVAFYARSIPRAIPWIILGALSFIFSVWYARSGLQYHLIICIIVDFIVWGIVYHFARRRWEILYAVCFQAMILINLIYMPSEFGYLIHLPDNFRVVILEISNATALMVIGITAMAESVCVGNNNIHKPVRSGLHNLSLSLLRKRPDVPFTKL